MNIYAEPGTKIKFIAKNGYEKELEEAKERLSTTRIYEVEYTDVSSWITYVKLKGIDGVFNSVMFEEVEGGP